MSTTIYYFSGTGNSLKVARDLAEKIGNCELVAMAKIWQQERIVAETERVGFVFPFYFWGLPDIVSEFVKKIDLLKASYVFAVITRRLSPGCAIHKIEVLLREKSKKLSAGFKVNMPGNFIPMYDMASEEKQQKIFKKAEDKVAHIAGVIKESQIEVEKDNFLFKQLAILVNNSWLKKVHGKDENFFIDDNCTSCGICEKVCPVNNISLVEGRPQWQHRCQQCLACIQFCPEEAIQCGTKTAKRQRYHQLDIKLKDIMSQR